MKLNALAAIILLSMGLPAAATEISHSPARNITVVAEAGTVSGWDSDGRRLWSAKGTATPTAVVTGSSQGAVLDALRNEVVIVDLVSGIARSHVVAGGPTEGVFVADTLFVLARESGEVVRITRDGQQRLAVGREPAFIRAAGDRLLVYSRIDGTLTLLDTERFRPDSRLQLDPFASDLETDGRYGYLTYPRSAQVISFSLEPLRESERFRVGAVPVDLAIVGKRTAMTAAQLAVADPSSKRIWREEGSQSMTAATARGVMRGLIGLGLYAPKSAEFPTGVDRVWFANRKLYAYDSASSSLFLVTGKKVRRRLTGVAAGEVAFTREGELVWWDAEKRRVRTASPVD